MDEKNFGIYLNKDKRGAYCNPNAPEKLIKYVTRAGRERKQELVSWGGVGVLEYSVESVIDQFYFAQKAHTRRGNFGRYMSHTLFAFSPEGEYAVDKNDMDVDEIARQMARDRIIAKSFMAFISQTKQNPTYISILPSIP